VPSKAKSNKIKGIKQMRRLKVIPEERKKPWSSLNFVNTPQGRWGFFFNPFLHYVNFTLAPSVIF
jgi:hypothetical protein